MKDPTTTGMSHTSFPVSGSEALEPDDTILINGTRTSLINVLDRGLQYGDGLFETIAVVDGRPLLWERHLERLSSGCARLGIPAVDTGLLTCEVMQMCRDHTQRVLKIIITRGVGGRGYRPNQPVQENMPTRILSLHSWPEYPQENASQGIILGLCTTRLGVNPALAGIKHLNRLEQVLARSEWNDPDIAEGLMLDSEGHVIEGTLSNLFIVSGEQLLTSDLSGSGVDGVMRGLVLDMAGALSIPARVTYLDLDDIKNADEIFLCNTLIRIWPVRRFEGIDFDDFKVTHAIAAELEKYIHA